MNQLNRRAKMNDKNNKTERGASNREGRIPSPSSSPFGKRNNGFNSNTNNHKANNMGKQWALQRLRNSNMMDDDVTESTVDLSYSTDNESSSAMLSSWGTAASWHLNSNHSLSSTSTGYLGGGSHHTISSVSSINTGAGGGNGSCPVIQELPQKSLLDETTHTRASTALPDDKDMIESPRPSKIKNHNNLDKEPKRADKSTTTSPSTPITRRKDRWSSGVDPEAAAAACAAPYVMKRSNSRDDNNNKSQRKEQHQALLEFANQCRTEMEDYREQRRQLSANRDILQESPNSLRHLPLHERQALRKARLQQAKERIAAAQQQQEEEKKEDEHREQKHNNKNNKTSSNRLPSAPSLYEHDEDSDSDSDDDTDSDDDSMMRDESSQAGSVTALSRETTVQKIVELPPELSSPQQTRPSSLYDDDSIDILGANDNGNNGDDDDKSEGENSLSLSQLSLYKDDDGDEDNKAVDKTGSPPQENEKAAPESPRRSLEDSLYDDSDDEEEDQNDKFIENLGDISTKEAPRRRGLSQSSSFTALHASPPLVSPERRVRKTTSFRASSLDELDVRNVPRHQRRIVEKVKKLHQQQQQQGDGGVAAAIVDGSNHSNGSNSTDGQQRLGLKFVGVHNEWWSTPRNKPRRSRSGRQQRRGTSPRRSRGGGGAS